MDKEKKIFDDLLHIEKRVELADRLKDCWHLLDVYMDSIKDIIEKAERHDAYDLNFVISLRDEFKMLALHAQTCSSVTSKF